MLQMIRLPLALLPLGVCGVLLTAQMAPNRPGPLRPIDPQQVQDQETMTWADYRPIPGANWADNSVPGERVLRVALDFPDQ